MESRHQTPSVMAKLMGLDKEPPQHPIGEKRRVLSEKYLHKVASIGFIRKRSSHQQNSLKMRIEEKEEYGEVLKVFKTTERDENHKLSEENGKKNPDLFETENLQLLQKINSGRQRNVHGETELYEMLMFPEPQPESKDGTFPSTIIVLKPNDQKVEGSLKCFSVPSSWDNDHLGNALLKEIYSPKSARSYPGMIERKKSGDHIESQRPSPRAFKMESIKQSPRAFSEVSEEVSSETGDATKGVLDMVSGSLFRGNETSIASSEKLNPVSMGYPITRSKNDIFHKYWGLRQGAYSNSLPQESKKQNINKKDCLKHMSLKSSPEKSTSLPSYSSESNHSDDNCISLHKLNKEFCGNDMSDQNPILLELSTSRPSLTCGDNQIMQHPCLMNDEVKNNKLEQNNISLQNTACPNSSIDGQVADEKTELVGGPCGNPKNQQSETTACIFSGDVDSTSDTSYGSIQQDTSEFHEDDSVYSICSEAQPGSLGSFEEAYEPSPISVLEPPFGENSSFSSDCLRVGGDDLCDSFEMDYEGQDLNVSSDEDCEDRSVGDFEEKQEFVRSFRAEESRDFSYVVEVLTEAGISNTSLYTDFSPQCPISPSVFEYLEMKFGKQPSWKRSDRRLLFDRINSALSEILQPCMCIPAWEKPMLRRMNADLSLDTIEEELWELLVAQEKEAKKESADKMLVGEISWIGLRDDIEDIVKEIEPSLDSLHSNSLLDQQITL
ncbi:DUF4378 domain protein [Senna tora]|uniref:DUF4378 domain protein n=1 Tax=Senna tora TaxID=362788 RepID=A0A834W682_9FABA|nr:DUF4378 domain protein [Senna tora]